MSLSSLMLPSIRGLTFALSSPSATALQMALRRVSSSTASTSEAAPSAAQEHQQGSSSQTGGANSQITPAALQELRAAFKQASLAASAVSNLATLTGLSGHYRDAWAAMETLYWQQAEGRPLRHAGSPAPARPPQPRSSYHSCPFFPIVDVTTLPDNHRSLPQGAAAQLDVRYMDRITCWKQVQPNHIETSTPLLTGISLFPPQEATYPTYVDFQAALRLLRMHKSRKRMSIRRRLRSRQDKYQLKTWDHHIGI